PRALSVRPSIPTRRSSDLRADDERCPDRIAEGQDDPRRDEPLANHDQRDHGRDEQRLAEYEARIEEHADRNEEQHREGIAQRERDRKSTRLNSSHVSISYA